MGNSFGGLSNVYCASTGGWIAQAPCHYVRRVFASQESGDVDTAALREYFPASRSKTSLRAADLFAQHNAAGDIAVGRVFCGCGACDGRKRGNDNRRE